MRNRHVTDAKTVKLTHDTIWILGAGASYDCTGDARPSVPLTANLVPNALGVINTDLFSHIAPFVRANSLSAWSYRDAIGNRLERTIDELRGLAGAGDDRARRALAETVRTVAAAVSVGSINAASLARLSFSNAQSRILS